MIKKSLILLAFALIAYSNITLAQESATVAKILTGKAHPKRNHVER